MSRATATKPAYGGLGLALLRALTGEGRSTFATAEARDAARRIGVADSYLPVLLHRLERSGLLQRVKHGTYALTTGLPGSPEAHPFALGMALVDPSAVSGWAALNHHGLTEQIPHVITLTTTRRVVTPAMRGAVRAAPSTWEVAGQRYEIGDARVRIFDRERALLDCFALPRRFGGLAEGLAIVEAHARDVNVERLVAHAVRYGTAAVAKRVGWALERAGIGAARLEPLRALPMRGQRALDPTRVARGARNPRWGLIENLASPRTRP